MNRLLIILLISLFLQPINAVKGENVAQGVKTIVIDAGHGGRFPGARYGGYSEKNINLQVALKLGALIEKNMPDIKVIYTRSVEKQFSSDLRTDLQTRADIANNANGDLFISIHANAHPKNTGVRGTETLIMGESKLETSVNEAILFANNKEEFLDMSDEKTAAIVRAHIQNLQFTYGEYSEAMAQLVQKHYTKLGLNNRGVKKQPLRVLYATDMPSILTEIGFMSNSAELKYITSTKGQNEIAQALFGAVKDYVAYVRKTLFVDSDSSATEGVAEPKSVTVAPQAEKQPAPVVKKEPSKAKTTEPKSKPAVKSSAVRYTVQIMASRGAVSLSDSRFGSYKGKVREVRADGVFSYKYCIGDYADKAVAQSAVKGVRKSFPQAFVIAVKDGRVVNK